MSRGRTLGQIADDGDRWSHVRWPCVRNPRREPSVDPLRAGVVRRLRVLRALVMAGGGGELQYRRTVAANRLRMAWDIDRGDAR